MGSSSGDVFEWSESLPARFRALGSGYWGYLFRALLGWMLAWLVIFGGLVLARWILGRAPWFDRRGIEGCIMAAALGVGLRLFLEGWPRMITMRGEALIINHGNWWRRTYRRQEKSSFEILRMDVRYSRVKVATLRGKVIVVGIPTAATGPLEEWLEAGRR